MSNEIPAFCQPWEFLQFCYCCFVFLVAKGRSECLLESSLCLRDILTRKLNLFLLTYHPFDCDNVEYEVSSQHVYHVIPPGHFSHP